MKKSVYLDTTIPSYFFDNRESLRTYVDVTKKWWAEERKKFKIYISEETIAEVNKGDYPNKGQILELISKIEVLPPHQRIFEIAQVYVDNYVMPKSLEGDSIHLAYASFYKMDFLLTWNCNHLANSNKKQHINIINTRLTLFTPEITTPLQLFKEDNS